MSNLEHYFENLLHHGADIKGEPNKNALSKEQQEAVEECATYVIYTIFCGREDFLARNTVVKELEKEPTCMIDKSNFSQEQYKTDLQCAYDCGKSIIGKIRAEIEQLPTTTRTNWNGCCPDIDYPEIEYIDVTKNKLLSILDKYMKESEET